MYYYNKTFDLNTKKTDFSCSNQCNQPIYVRYPIVRIFSGTQASPTILNVVLMLGQRRSRWTSIETIMAQDFVFASAYLRNRS